MLKQLSIYAENKKGALQAMTNALYEAGINIWGSVTNDGAEYGINRMVVSDPDKAKEVLTEKGYLCRFVDVLAVEIEDKPGALNALLTALLDSNVNVDYTYLSFNRDSYDPAHRRSRGSGDLPEGERIQDGIAPASMQNQK